MKKAILNSLLSIFMLKGLYSQSVNSQLKEPEVGRLCPEFVLNKIDFYKNKKVSMSDLKGKWVVLDFWSKLCTGCIASFPKISQEQMEFGDSVQFIMITRDTITGERELYANYHNKLNLTMPSAFDNDLFRSFNVGQLPHIIIIDPHGIVRAITTSVPSSKIRELMNGENPIFRQASYANRKDQLGKFKHNYKAPFLIYGNGGVDSNFIFRSLLTQWEPNNPRFENESMLKSQEYAKSCGRFEIIGYSVAILYRAAYLGKTKVRRDDTCLYGKFFPNPVFEVEDSSLLRYDMATGKNVYCYSLSVPASKATEKHMMQVMQNDLKNYFGYEVMIENRKMPYWRLIATDYAKNRLVTKGGPALISNNGKPMRETILKNSSMSLLIKLVENYSKVTIGGIPLLDETGITANIDLDLDWVWGDYEICRKALQKNGLDLVSGEKEMKCIVIRDPKPEDN